MIEDEIDELVKGLAKEIADKIDEETLGELIQERNKQYEDAMEAIK